MPRGDWPRMPGRQRSGYITRSRNGPAA